MEEILDILDSLEKPQNDTNLKKKKILRNVVYVNQKIYIMIKLKEG